MVKCGKDNLKQCCRCGVKKSLDNFHRTVRTLDGHHYHCKECHKKRYAQLHPKPVRYVREDKMEMCKKIMEKCEGLARDPNE